jgi:hypothetical protein
MEWKQSLAGGASHTISPCNLEGSPSVLVCVITCRRPAGLGRLLEALTEQVVTKSHFEILVVDNDAGGSARPVVDALAGKAGRPSSMSWSQSPGSSLLVITV